MADLWLNGTKLTNYTLQTPYSDTIDEELDKLNFQIKSVNRITFHKNDRIVYQIKQPNDNNQNSLLVNKIFCLFDWVETLEGEYWLYQLTLLSPTKLLENIIINGMAETKHGLSESLRTQFVRTINKINKQQFYENEQPIEITYSNNDLTPLSSYETTDFLWSGQMTAREILQDILDKCDYLLIGTNFTIQNGNILTINVSIVKREKVGKTILTSNSSIEGGGLDAIKSVLKGLTIHRDSEYNCGSIISLTHNAVCKDNIQQNFLPPRNDDLTIDDSADWHILTQEPIYSLNKVEILIPATANTDNSTYVSAINNGTLVLSNFGTAPVSMYGWIVDITQYIVEKDVFDAMDLSEQAKHLYFKRGEKGIYGLYKKYKYGQTGLFSHTAIFEIIENLPNGNIPIVYQGELQSGYTPFLYYYQATGENQRLWHTSAPSTIQRLKDGEWQVNDIYNLYLRKLYTGYDPTDRENFYKDCMFSVDYQPYCDSVVKIEKSIIEGNVKNLSVLKNQSDRTIDASKYYDSQTALINRLGNEEMTLDCMFDLTKTKKLDDSNIYECLWELGDIIYLQSDKYTLTKREIENYGNDLLKCRLTFSKNFNATNSAINMNRDKRLYGIPLNNFVDRYILIRKPNDKDYTKLAVYSYDDFTNNTETSGYTILNFNKIGNDSQIDRVARCKDNYAVDIERTKYSSTIVNINLRYCGTDGFSDTIWLRFLTDNEYNSITISDYSRLPFIEGSLSVGDNIALTIYKDKMERLIFILI